ncbi:MAG: carboxymuconolactone decarboxylase family protein [Planctomycetes bacterium]|nr:carboxymuconolactone decarboxylase family protein [Planctomycetota bacterium]
MKDIKNKRFQRSDLLKVPERYEKFSALFPGIAEAWDVLRESEKEAGPLDEKTIRLVKLGVSVGARMRGAVSSGVRKALKTGITKQEILQVIALSASTIGLPSTVAAYSWIEDILDESNKDQKGGK